MKSRTLLRTATFGLVVLMAVASSLFVTSAQLTTSNVAPKLPTITTTTTTAASLPKEFDVRGFDGVPKGTSLRVPQPTQLLAIKALETAMGTRLTVQYNGLTATPRHLFSRGKYLSAPASLAPETIARDFLSAHRSIFRFSERDLRNLKLKSRATVPDMGTTILLFEQTEDGLPVYNGGVLVNINRAGQIMSVGGESFPQLTVSNAARLSPEQTYADAYAISPERAITLAAADLGFSGFNPQRAGSRKVPQTFGDLPREYVAAPKYSGGGVFSDEIVVTKTIFPLGSQARLAYKLVLTTPQYSGIMWENIVDAQTGKVLRRISLTSFQSGGGSGVGRRGTFRPDVQNLVEAHNQAGTSKGKVTDTAPTALSGYRGFGRSPAPGVAPTYGLETAGAADRLNGRGFKQSQVFARNENPLIYGTGYGQVERGFPDAQNPSASSPFGWFYLPTNTGGTEITTADSQRATTRDYGYTMNAEAKTRNLPANSPGGDGDQPFAASSTALVAPITLPDGRTLASVIESKYTEGNNVLVADDRSNDNEGTHGVKGFSPNKQFTASYFDYTMGYEFGNVNAGGTPFYPASSDPDVYPGAVTLFYYNNLIHDYLYSIGFTEPLWNFQQDNFGKGGEGSDGLSAQVQDGSGTNNANMGTNADGTAPRMQMYLFTEDVFRRSDGDFDFDVVAHEYYHGVSNRSAAKGASGCLGVAFFGESGGQGEGWSDTIAESMTDDDSTGEFVTGEHDKGIRTIPVTNFRWSYGSIDGRKLNRRDQQTADLVGAPGVGVGVPPTTPAYQVHHVGTVFSAMTWDMRELLIMKQKVNGAYPGIFFDGTRRLGGGTPFYIGERQVQSVDANHPIDYRASFNTHAIVQPAVGSTNPVPAVVPTINAAQHIVRPGQVAGEYAALGHRNGPLSQAVSQGARLADTLVLRGLQLSPCNPSIVDTRDSILLADKELTGGENRAVIWRAFASHGVGQNATSSHSGEVVTDPASSMVPVIVEDFTVPASVLACEQQGPLTAPTFTLANTTNNTVTITVNALSGAAKFIVSRSESATGPFTLVAEVNAPPVGNATINDNNGGQGLVTGNTYFYQVRASRDAESNCVSSANTDSILIEVGTVIIPAPLFTGVDRVDDPQDGVRLIVSWKPATSVNPTASIVYDVFREAHVEHGDGTQEPTFTPSAANRIATNLTGTSFNDTGLELARAYYYIVQARDTSINKIDTNDTGNRVTKYNAPTITQLGTPVFALETFENASASSRFTPPLTESGGNPNQASQTFQRITGINFGGGGTVGKMYAPDFSPGDENGLPDPGNTRHGGASDFSTVVGPLSLTPTSIMSFDNFINAEATFDGGVIEVAVGGPNFNATPYPDNVTTFDLGNYIIEGGYNNKLDGQIEGAARGSILQGRRAYTGAKGLHRVRATLNSFAPGGIHNPNNLPVYIRFRMTSDAATADGLDAGWFIDNLVINNLACLVNLASSASGAVATASTTYSDNFPTSGAIDGDRKGGDWGNGGGWNDSTRDVWPDMLEVALNGTRSISEIRVYTLQDDFRNPQEPTPDLTATYYGLENFDVQYWTGEEWRTVPGGNVVGNDKVMRTFTFPAITTTKLRVVVNSARNHFSRIVEVEALGCAGS